MNDTQPPIMSRDQNKSMLLVKAKRKQQNISVVVSLFLLSSQLLKIPKSKQIKKG